MTGIEINSLPSAVINNYVNIKVWKMRNLRFKWKFFFATSAK